MTICKETTVHTDFITASFMLADDMLGSSNPGLNIQAINPLDSKGNYSATSNSKKLVHWPLMGGLLHVLQRKGPLLSVPNVAAHPSMASILMTVLLYDGPLLCGFNEAIKENLASITK